MARRAAVIGGSVAGLASAIGLARRGWEVTVVERDLAPDTNDGDEAFLVWDRRNVPQFRQPHAFSARSRNLLLEHIPEVVDWLRADGIAEVNLFKMLAPPELWSDEDDAYTGLWSRRPAFELGIRRIAEAEPGVTIVVPAIVRGLLTDEGSAPLRVTGIVLADGTEIDADLVLDCAGRRSPVAKWLAEKGIEVPQQLEDCNSVYHARYYRLNAESGMSLFGILGAGQQMDRVNIIGFPGDHDTYGLAVFIRPDDDELKIVRQDWAWDALFAKLPRLAAWSDPDVGTPLTSVQFMGGHQNTRSHHVVDGVPLVHGLLPVGDSLCTTNPMYGWGASMALTYAFAAVDAATSHAHDLEATALGYAAAVDDEADSVYRESSAMDRARNYRWNNEEIPEWDRAEVARQDLIGCIAAGALRDPVLGRAQLRRMNLLEPPGAVLDDPEVVEHAQHTQQILMAKAKGPSGPEREELLDAIAAANPNRS
jgi:2-polyprenyl-6-methoxyphenol hydroxylase-like FAD-dependent oxidoreductase